MLKLTSGAHSVLVEDLKLTPGDIYGMVNGGHDDLFDRGFTVAGLKEHGLTIGEAAETVTMPNRIPVVTGDRGDLPEGTHFVFRREIRVNKPWPQYVKLAGRPWMEIGRGEYVRFADLLLCYAMAVTFANLNRFEPGDLVRIVKDEERPELVGQCGRVEMLTTLGKRYEVRLSAGGGTRYCNEDALDVPETPKPDAAS